MEAPQIVLAIYIALELGCVLAKHGEPKDGLNADYNIFMSLIGASIWVVILWWGGFWT